MHTCNHTFSVNDYLNEMHIERVEDMDAARAEEYARIDALYEDDQQMYHAEFIERLMNSDYVCDDRRELIDGAHFDRIREYDANVAPA